MTYLSAQNTIITTIYHCWSIQVICSTLTTFKEGVKYHKGERACVYLIMFVMF